MNEVAVCAVARGEEAEAMLFLSDKSVTGYKN